MRIQRRFRALTSLLVLASLVACGGAQTFNYTLKSGASITAIDPLSLSTTVLNLDASNSSQVASASSSVTSWKDSLNSSTAWSASGSISLVSDSNTWLSIPAASAFSGAGRLPDHFGSQFTFFFVASQFPDGSQLRFGVDDQTDALLLSAAGGKVSLTHQTNSTSYQKRTYATAITGATVIAAVFGSASKDFELYVNGVRQTQFTSTSSGSATSYQAIARDFKLSVASSGNGGAMKAGRLLMVKDKLSPRSVYAISKSLATSWGVTIPTQVGSEVINDTMPPIEPDTVDSSYIYSAILTPKCLSCHQPGGVTNIYFQTYSLLTTTSSYSGRFVVPGNSAQSRIYVRVLDNSMPAGGASPLSDNEKALIKSWIDAGAPQ